MLSTNSRALAILSVRNIVRAMFTLAVVYTTRWNHPKESWKYSTVNSTKVLSLIQNNWLTYY